jgi:hypothetical protein
LFEDFGLIIFDSGVEGNYGINFEIWRQSNVTSNGTVTVFENHSSGK